MDMGVWKVEIWRRMARGHNDLQLRRWLEEQGYKLDSDTIRGVRRDLERLPAKVAGSLPLEVREYWQEVRQQPQPVRLIRSLADHREFGIAFGGMLVAFVGAPILINALYPSHDPEPWRPIGVSIVSAVILAILAVATLVIALGFKGLNSQVRRGLLLGLAYGIIFGALATFLVTR